ncbi:MAG: hypothetical protein H7288_11510 [Kineosporiaceae bacterium]|nr:hypothetical protein [Aeromicrobium sp.]
MSTPTARKPPTGTPRIVWGSILLALAVLLAIRLLDLVLTGDTAYIWAPVVFFLALAGGGVAVLLSGLDERKKRP